MANGAKLAVASVAHATPLFLLRPEIIYINVLHYSAPPRTYLLCATPPLCPDWRHWSWPKVDTVTDFSTAARNFALKKGQNFANAGFVISKYFSV